jgi:predicted short-subunit dehydrogenase-like oxidoreductase (DUF2520 family)
MVSKPTITLIGAGNLAHALALALHSAGYRIEEIISRPSSQLRAGRLARQVGARAAAGSNARLSSDILWFCVNDDAIRGCAEEYAARLDWNGKVALHSSGALASDELRSLKRRGAAVGSAHPMMTFVAGKAAGMKNVAFALEGDAAAVRAARLIARDLGGHAFQIRRENKALYHAIGGFCSPLVIALLATGEKVARHAKVPASEVPRVMQPILQRTIENYMKQGAAASFSGPINRGDVATVRKHLAALKKVPQAREIYLAVARAAVASLPVKNKRELQQTLRSKKSEAGS